MSNGEGKREGGGCGDGGIGEVMLLGSIELGLREGKGRTGVPSLVVALGRGW